MRFSTIVTGIIIGICVWLDKINKVKKASESNVHPANEPPKQYNMDFEYRQISAERCGEINSMRIRDLSASEDDTVFCADGKNFVTNQDESILFYRLFLSEDTGDENRKAVFLCIRDRESHSLTVEFKGSNIIWEDENLLNIWNHLLSNTVMLHSVYQFDSEVKGN